MADRFHPNRHAWLTTADGFTSIVRVMTIAEGYAMVRKAGCAPFVVALREIEFVKQKEAAHAGEPASADARTGGAG